MALQPRKLLRVPAAKTTSPRRIECPNKKPGREDAPSFRSDAVNARQGLRRGGGDECPSAALQSNQARLGKVPKRKPGYRAGPSLRTYYSPVKNLRANLTRQEIGKAWRDRSGKMASN